MGRKRFIMKQKYVLTDESINFAGHTLYRIKAIRSFGNIEEGDLGGWIEDNSSLDHDDNCWVGGNAIVFNSGIIRGDALVTDDAVVFNAIIDGDAVVCDKAQAYGGTRMFGGTLKGSSEAYDGAIICSGESYDSKLVRG